MCFVGRGFSTYCPICEKTLHVVMTSLSEFHEKRRRKGHALRIGINKITLTPTQENSYDN